MQSIQQHISWDFGQKEKGKYFLKKIFYLRVLENIYKMTSFSWKSENNV